MNRPEIQTLEFGSLPYLLALPSGPIPSSGVWPLLCFLHGYDEGAPMPIQQALTRHGPLASTSSAKAGSEFMIIAPQLPVRGDLWHRHADAVRIIVQQAQAEGQADPQQTFLTGFSFGGNGVFDLALEQPDFWAALWPVDPTRPPPQDPRRPVWLSSGEISRQYARTFIQRLGLLPPNQEDPDDRIYLDQGEDHVGTARLAYHEDRIYDWLLSKRLTDSTA